MKMNYFIVVNLFFKNSDLNTSHKKMHICLAVSLFHVTAPDTSPLHSGWVNGFWRLCWTDGTQDDGRDCSHAGTQRAPICLCAGQSAPIRYIRPKKNLSKVVLLCISVLTEIILFICAVSLHVSCYDLPKISNVKEPFPPAVNPFSSLTLFLKVWPWWRWKDQPGWDEGGGQVAAGGEAEERRTRRDLKGAGH